MISYASYVYIYILFGLLQIPCMYLYTHVCLENKHGTQKNDGLEDDVPFQLGESLGSIMILSSLFPSSIASIHSAIPRNDCSRLAST